ncbi:isopenicillin N synthase family oxygenase [Alteromonas aestuariivivens]|uniref:2-oxoglutarate-dependent ethylene/succinate-forming enzyme n=1 Tax=Alteromonas aestuariivivens TaxID=1938339 RepID=A0A3D8MEH0_9ALTE|nr:2-oxoglutarate and iron-dependent oxygenase domain-containing protein [Alteromonas aestuariivivens]RDV29225.1 isopenicillin N synthase family oxygenase [Alteromonas aestuariivivens]
MTTKQHYSLDELNLETRIGGMGVENDCTEIPLIDFSDFENRRQHITEALWQAATQVGFFQVENHGITLDTIKQTFGIAESYFALPAETKALNARPKGQNVGWEFMTQVRPSTGTQDQKESYQITLPHMASLWPQEQVLADFKSITLAFEQQAWALGMKILSCFADKLGFERDFFTRAHDRSSPEYQSTLRLLHYLPLQQQGVDAGLWRAGAHTDFDCLTMVFQKTGQDGLQACAGKDAQDALSWTSAKAQDGIITCNIGDMLMRWSDDKLKSTLHRVRMPREGEYQGSRYSLAFFCQANKDMIIQGPENKYPPISAEDYLNLRIQANFAK